MSLYDKMTLGFGEGFGVGISKLFNLKPTDGTGDFPVVRADADASELVTNGAFAADTDWTKGTGWTIGSGLATSTGAIGGITQSISVTSGVEYYVEVTTSGGSYSLGGLKIRLGGTTDLATITEDGTYTFKLTCEGADTLIGFYVDASNVFSGSIDDISVKSAEFQYGATRINSEGLIEGVRPNTPRSSFPDGGSANGCPFLLTEPASTNRILQSEVWSSASWTKRGSPIVSETNLAPNGLLTATRLTLGNSGTLDTYQIATGLTNSATFYNSIYMKRITTTGSLKLNNPAAAGQWNIDLSLLSDDWERITVNHAAVTVVTPFLASGSGQGGILLASLDTTVRDVYVWGAQTEQAETASYIPTTTTVITRPVDLIGPAGAAGDFNSQEGVLYCEIAALKDDQTRRKIFLSDGTANNFVSINYETAASNNLYATYVVGGVAQATFSTTAYTITDFLKIAVKWKVNDFALWINGVEVDTDLSGSVAGANTFDELRFNDLGSNIFFGKCRTIMVFNEALTDSELTELTS